jgi:Zn-dependent peptidase ImmA (M78 family)/transcriptional regulator with XRE-family HTH domain
MSFNPQRLSIARKRRLQNQKGFAEKAGVAAHTVSRCETGQTVPTEANVIAFAKASGFPVPFFYGPDLDVPSADLVSFRSQKSMSAATRDAALSAGAVGFMISDWVEERFELPRTAVPDLHLYEPEAAARTLRQEWGLGEKPISNMVHLLESKGVRVLSLAENSKRVNAFSLWRAEKAYVFLNTMKSVENSRFDAAHELGHLVLHQDGKTTGRQAEDQANRFASAFLMPRSDVLAVLPRVHYLEQIVQVKKRWKVSVAALNYRLHKIGVTTDWKYRDFCIQISQKGFNVHEPHEIEREKSVVWQKVIKTLWSEKTTQKDIAAGLHLPESEVNALIFGVLHNGGNERPEARQQLSLVKNEQSA